MYLPGGDPGLLDAMRDGAAQVQDEGSQLVARALTLAPVDGADGRWLDLCAGPGGKTSLLAAIAAGSGARVTAVEPDAAPGRARRAGHCGVWTSRCCGSTGARPGLPAASFDRVLVDAPCTGLGALRRRPEARWRRQPGDVPALAKLQTRTAGRRRSR